MGSWWVYTADSQASEQQELDEAEGNPSPRGRHGRLMRIPTTREDVVYSDKSIDLRSKRVVMKVLRFVMKYENQPDLWEPYSSRPFSDFLTEQFKLPLLLHDLFLAITLSLDPPYKTTTAFALPRIARHLRSTGKLGPGFSSVIPKWGGLSEIAQVGCRAGAVGGTVYVLGKGIKSVEPLPKGGEAQGAESIPGPAPKTNQPVPSEENKINASYNVILDDNETVRTAWIASSENELEPQSQPLPNSSESPTVSKSISIVSSTLAILFPNLAEGIPPPAGAVVVFPSGSLKTVEADPEHPPPLHLIVHSSETGECPKGQSVIYATTIGSQDLITMGILRLLRMSREPETPQVLWSLRYQQCSPEHPSADSDQVIDSREDSFVTLPSPSLDLVFDETILDTVKSAWERILGADTQDFLVFEDRNGMGEDDEGDDE